MKTADWTLVDSRTGREANEGDKLTTSTGATVFLCSAMPPEHSGSTGRIYVREPSNAHQRGFFPSVCNLLWIRKVGK